MKYIVFFLLLQSTYFFAQPLAQEGLTLFKVEVKEYLSPIESGGGNHPFGSIYKGTLKKAIVNAWSFPLTRFRFNKEPPLRYVSFEALSSRNPANARLLVQQNMQTYFKFTVTDRTDSIEVWVIHKVDTTKFIPFNYETHGGYGGWGECMDADSWEADGAPISELAKEYERKSGNLSIFEGNNEGIYYFDIPYSFMKDAEEFNAFLKRFIGLEMTKEKRLMAVKYVTFE